MFYKYADYPEASKFAVLCANIDTVCDFIPVVSTVTNITRVALSILSTISWGVLSAGIGIGYAFKGLWIALFQKNDKQFSIGLCFYHWINASLLIQSLWIKTFFTHHYFKKTYLDSFYHAIPLLGNVIAFIKETKSYEANIKNWEETLHRYQIKPGFDQRGPLFSYSYPDLIPSYLKNNKKLIVANCRLNPYHITSIAKEHFADFSFIKDLMKVLTYDHHGKSSYIKEADFIYLMEYLVKEAQKKGYMIEIQFPIADYLQSQNETDKVALLQKYPDFLWLMPPKKAFDYHRYVAPVIPFSPHCITMMNDDFFQKHKTMALKAVTQDPLIASKLSIKNLLSIFRSKDNVLDDSVFLACDGYQPGLKAAMVEYLNRKKIKKALQVS